MIKDTPDILCSAIRERATAHFAVLTPEQIMASGNGKGHFFHRKKK